jgi:hypothetical protein
MWAEEWSIRSSPEIVRDIPGRGHHRFSGKRECVIFHTPEPASYLWVRTDGQAIQRCPKLEMFEVGSEMNGNCYALRANGKALLVAVVLLCLSSAARAQSGAVSLQVTPDPVQPGERVTVTVTAPNRWSKATGRVVPANLPINFSILPARTEGKYQFTIPPGARNGNYLIRLTLTDANGNAQRGQTVFAVDSTGTVGGNVPGNSLQVTLDQKAAALGQSIQVTVRSTRKLAKRPEARLTGASFSVALTGDGTGKRFTGTVRIPDNYGVGAYQVNVSAQDLAGQPLTGAANFVVIGGVPGAPPAGNELTVSLDRATVPAGGTLQITVTAPRKLQRRPSAAFPGANSTVLLTGDGSARKFTGAIQVPAAFASGSQQRIGVSGQDLAGQELRGFASFKVQ